MEADVGVGILIVPHPGHTLRYCQHNLRLFDEEKETGPMVFLTYYDAFYVCVAQRLCTSPQLCCTGYKVANILPLAECRKR